MSALITRWRKFNTLYRFRIAGVANHDLTTAQLSERTGLSAGTLRMWENRHAFPRPNRLPGGHRRYSDRDVEQVQEVVRLRQQGLSLPAAIELVRRDRGPQVASMFAGLHRQRPDVTPMVLTKPALLALTRAIEDEYCARATDGILIGCFQREHFYRASQHRWRELARTARFAVAVADFPERADPVDAALELPIQRGHALAREWALLVSAPGAQACLAGWERPSVSEAPDDQRRFEVLWSFAPSVVADAVEVAVALLEPLDPELAGRVATAREQTPPTPEVALDHGLALAHRMIGYLGAIVDAAGGRPPRPTAAQPPPG